VAVEGVEVEHGVYTIQRGDSLSEIAAEYKTTVPRLVQLNPELEQRSLNLIFPGQQLWVPKPAAPQARVGASTRPPVQTLPAPRVASVVQLTIVPEAAKHLPIEEQTSLAVFTRLAGQPVRIAALRRAIGAVNSANTPLGVEVIGSASIRLLAEHLGRAGYPANPMGIRLLQQRHGIRESGVGPLTAGLIADIITGVTDAKRPDWSEWQSHAISSFAPLAVDSMLRTGIPASVTIAQALLESDWGRRVQGNNYFGIKGHGPAGSVRFLTHEYVGGVRQLMPDTFRAYRSMADSFADHARMISTSSIYRGAMAFKDDAVAFAREVHRSGYATWPGYADALANLMHWNALGRFDQR
jgi:LysM repeat protein